MRISRGSHTDRSRAESFGQVADAYDRFRPSYPPGLIDDLLTPWPERVLDIGTGTGKAATLLAARGADVLGVEIDAAMAAVARGHGLRVEVSGFEEWDAAGRTFDLITCAQAWHWIDPEIGRLKLADLLRPGGRAVLFWNYDELEPAVQQAVTSVYRRLAPELAESVVIGGTHQSDRPHVAEFEATGRFARVDATTYRWSIERTTAEWLAMVGTHSDHLRRPPDQRAQLAAELGAVLERLGGEVVSNYTTYAVSAAVPA